MPEAGAVGHDDPDVVQSICLLRKGDQSLPVLAEVKALVKALNESPGRLLPGVRIQPYYDRTDLIHVTTETVRENLLAGIVLVTLVLFMFLTDVRAALIVAINIPLALLFAFGTLFLRGKSANLLSIGAVDFGIIVDSTVIIVENIYRHLSAGLHADEPLGRRIILASNEIQHCLFYSTAIMICASCRCSRCRVRKGRFSAPWPRPTPSPWACAVAGTDPLTRPLHLPPETRQPQARQPPGAMATGRLHAAVATLLGPSLANPGFFHCHRGRHRGSAAISGRRVHAGIGRGEHLGPGPVSLEFLAGRICTLSQKAHDIMKRFPESEMVLTQVGRPDNGTDPAGFYNAEFFMPLKPHSQWPIPSGRDRPRTKEELTDELSAELKKTILSVEWNFSQNIRNMVMESLSGVRGENSVKIVGPDLEELEKGPTASSK